ncbi:MAG: VOC family protein [Fibrobacteria bacterium]|nr:VOC family protein [Fibrobacteria bacterium]
MSEFIHTGITVEDVDRTVAWYQKYFGFTEVKRFEKDALEIKAAAVIALGDAQIEVIQPNVPELVVAKMDNLIETLRPMGTNHFAIGVNDIEKSYKELSESGAHMITEVMGGKMFFCCDPDGTVIEVKQS